MEALGVFLAVWGGLAALALLVLCWPRGPFPPEDTGLPDEEVG